MLNLRRPAQNVFAGRSGNTATWKHSQELTTKLLEFKATGVFMALVVGPPYTVPSRDHFLSPVYNGLGSYE